MDINVTVVLLFCVIWLVNLHYSLTFKPETRINCDDDCQTDDKTCSNGLKPTTL